MDNRRLTFGGRAAVAFLSALLGVLIAAAWRAVFG